MRERAGLVGLTALAPVLWALGDLAVTGDALHSLHGTANLAEAAGRRRSIDIAPYWTLKYFGSTLREPLVIGIPIGLAFAWLHRRRPAILPLAVAAAMVAVFMAGPLFGLPLIGRYVRTPAILLALFYGLAVFGWRLLPDGPARRRWLAAGVLAGALSLAFLPWHAKQIGSLHERLHRDGELYRDLQSIAYAAPVRDAFERCGGRITAADHRPIPYLRYWLHGDPYSVGTVAQSASPLSDLLLVPRRTRRPRIFYKENFPSDVRPPAGWRVLEQNRSWRVYASPGCSG
jgi:hypothetical protein